MENVSSIANILSILLSSLGLTYLVFWRFKQLRIDEFRQSIFILRDELFDYAAHGNISLDHPAYTKLRSMMNGYVRYSHQLSLIHFICVAVSTYFFNRKVLEKGFATEWREAVSGLDEQTKAKMEDFKERASSKVFHYVFLSSYFKKTLAIFSGLGVLILIKFLIRKVERKNEELDLYAYKYSNQHSWKMRRSIDTFNSGAYNFGKI